MEISKVYIEWQKSAGLQTTDRLISMDLLDELDVLNTLTQFIRICAKGQAVLVPISWSKGF
jgi:hypothetical protein